jgi:asparagine synthase (glutamine-hydrolysing)
MAGAVAELYGATHVMRRVTEAEFHADLPGILDAMDQPSIDGVNTWFVAKAAREAGLKVALSGLGGDELLGGYPSFRDIPQWTRWLGGPAAVPGLGAGLRLLGGALGVSSRSPKALGLVEFGGTYRGAYLLRRGLFLPSELPAKLGSDLVREGLRRLRPLSRIQASMTPDPGSPFARICALESANYMRNQLLRDADWAGMAHSLEVRCPLVDFELLRTLAPAVHQMNADKGKRALAAAPSTPLPKHLAQRAKTGFSVPTDRWLADTAHALTDRPISKGLASRAWGLELFEAHWAPAAAL